MTKRFIVELPPSSIPDKKRLRLKRAELLMTLVDHTPLDRGLPYEQTPGDTYNYVLDRANDWWVRFDPQDDNKFYLQHRGGDPRDEEALTNWAASALFNWKCTITPVEV